MQTKSVFNQVCNRQVATQANEKCIQRGVQQASYDTCKQKAYSVKQFWKLWFIERLQQYLVQEN